MANLILNKDQLLLNIETIENYLTEGNEEQRNKILDYIRRGTCFVAYQIYNEVRFAPSKFLGYDNNTLEKHIPIKTDGRETNKAINKILNSRPTVNLELEKKYRLYCSNFGKITSTNGAYGARRKFWLLNMEYDFQRNQELTGEFPEGKMVERTHKTRESNSEVIKIAKENFKKLNGKLYCQICRFSFEDKYGKIGKDFIEGHHTIPVSNMEIGHKTKPEDIAIPCSNCHRMIHKQRPWLDMSELSHLIKASQR